MQKYMLLIGFFLVGIHLSSQDFYLGADLSYVNEMEDCGVVYTEEGVAKDPFAIFADHGANTVRLRLWHTPSWYDQLNEGNRYSDLADVKRSIQRAHEQGMEVLLDFHLADTWADPSRQIAPAAWSAVLDDLPVLSDSLYNYIYQVLTELANENLWPELIQLGNETNRGILLSQEENDAGWVLDWPRNATLFNRGLTAIRTVAEEQERDTKIGLHLAGPANVEWFLERFHEEEVSDFDFIGISYYWAWHQPTTISEAAEVVARLRQTYPSKEVIILETGYIWTNDWNDDAANIITDVHPDYSPASSEAQYNWLVDFTQAVRSAGGSGVLYWEPAWVSSPCWTQWGQGSHQEHATFFDFQNDLTADGGIGWLSAEYDPTITIHPQAEIERTDFTINYLAGDQRAVLSFSKPLSVGNWQILLIHLDGKHLGNWSNIDVGSQEVEIQLPNLSAGIYFVALLEGTSLRAKEPLVIMKK